jgi:hypothetical protein
MKKLVGMKYLVETLKDLAKTRDLIEPKELVARGLMRRISCLVLRSLLR